MSAKPSGTSKPSAGKVSSTTKSFKRSRDGQEAQKSQVTGVTAQQLRSTQKLDAVLAKSSVSKAEVKSAAGAMQFNAQAPDQLGRGSNRHIKRVDERTPYVNAQGEVYKTEQAKKAAANLDKIATKTKATKKFIKRHHAPALKMPGGPANARSGVSSRVKMVKPQPEKPKTPQQERTLAILSAARSHKSSLAQGKAREQGMVR